MRSPDDRMDQEYKREFGTEAETKIYKWTQRRREVKKLSIGWSAGSRLRKAPGFVRRKVV